MNAAVAHLMNPAGSLRRNLMLLLPALLLFLVLMGVQVWRANSAGQPELMPNGVPISKEIEEKFGVRFTGLYVIGKGGLIDLRYRIIDVGKAKNFGHYTETSPLLVPEDGGPTVEVTIMGLHNHRVEAGRTYYVLYRNTGNAVRPGKPVTLQIGDLRLEHVMAQ